MNINNAQVDKNHPDIKGAKNITDLKKLNIFTDDKDYETLWDAIKPKNPAPAGPAQQATV